MAKTYNRLELDVNKKPNSIITEVQGDSNSRYLDVSLFNNGVPLDLTGHEVKIFMKKPENGGEIWNDGVITDATAGRCEFLMTAEALSKMGHLQTQVSIWKDNTEILSTQVFEINVTKTLLGNSSVESSNEYGTLVLLFQNLYEAHDLMVDMVSSFGKKGAVADARDIATFWQGVEYLAKYMDTDLKGLIEKALANASVQGVLDLIGTSEDSGNTTVFGKENAILENTIPLYRPDDYLVQAITKKFVLLQNEEKSATYKHDTLVGTINLPNDCTKIILKGNFKGDSMQVYLNNAADNTTYKRIGYFNNGEETYTAQEFVLEQDTPLPSALKVYLYRGNTGTVYCNNLTIEAYTLKRVVTKELYETGTIKSYGTVGSLSDTPYLPQCPRLDRVDYLTGHNSSTSAGTTVEVDNIPFVRKIGDYKGYRIRY
ncbi:BppU family phage baseplate upper protein [Anaerotignum faecicola]